MYPARPFPVNRIGAGYNKKGQPGSQLLLFTDSYAILRAMGKIGVTFMFSPTKRPLNIRFTVDVKGSFCFAVKGSRPHQTTAVA